MSDDEGSIHFSVSMPASLAAKLERARGPIKRSTFVAMAVQYMLATQPGPPGIEQAPDSDPGATPSATPVTTRPAPAEPPTDAELGLGRRVPGPKLLSRPSAEVKRNVKAVPKRKGK